MPSKVKNLKLEKAQYAFDAVDKVIKKYPKNGGDQNKKVLKEYKSYARSLGAMIKMQGLGATMAFILARKDKAAYLEIYNQLSTWMYDNALIKVSTQKSGNQFANDILYLSSSQYRYTTREVLDLIQWIRRYAEGLIESDEKDKEASNTNIRHKL